MAKKTAPKKVEIESSLDPLFPLPANTGIFPVQNGGGKEILSDTHVVMLELPFNAFYDLWAYVERRAAQEYPKRKADPNEALRSYAEGQLASVHAFRSAFRGEVLPLFTEEEAAKIRKKEGKRAKRAAKAVEGDSTQLELGLDAPECPMCHSKLLGKKKRDGKKIWKCLECGHRWPRNLPGSTPVGRSKARSGKKQGSAGRNAETATQRPKKRPKKKP